MYRSVACVELSLVTTTKNMMHRLSCRWPTQIRYLWVNSPKASQIKSSLPPASKKTTDEQTPSKIGEADDPGNRPAPNKRFLPSLGRIPLFSTNLSEQTDENPSSTSSQLVKSLLFGSKEGRKAEQEMEQSYSTMLMRGKYLHEMVVHKVKPDKVDNYVDLM